jgi:hypothetical protein
VGFAILVLLSPRTDLFCVSVEFLQDGLYCEWAYFIDFESQKFETWKGNADEGGSGELIDTVSFDELREEGKDGWLVKIEEFRH